MVSGGAFGIDGAAHRGALAGSGLTVAVVAGGLRTPYPQGHAALFARIARDGLLVSEWPPDATPQRHRFLVRNRLIAALTSGTVVVEAGVRSGALATGRQALRCGRVVMGVPGPVTSAESVGVHQFLRSRDEVSLVTRAAEVVELVGRIGDDLAPRLEAPAAARDGLEPVALRVLDGLPAAGEVSPDRIAVDRRSPGARRAALPARARGPRAGRGDARGVAAHGGRPRRWRSMIGPGQGPAEGGVPSATSPRDGHPDQAQRAAGEGQRWRRLTEQRPRRQHGQRRDEVGGHAEAAGVHPGQGVGPGAERQSGRHEAEVEHATDRSRGRGAAVRQQPAAERQADYRA